MKEVALSLVAFSLGTKRSQLPLTLQCVCMYVCTTDTLVYTQPLLGTRKCHENFGDFLHIATQMLHHGLIIEVGLQLLGAWQQFQCLQGQSLLAGEGDSSEQQWSKEAQTRNSLGCTSGRDEGGGSGWDSGGKTHAHTVLHFNFRRAQISLDEHCNTAPSGVLFRDTNVYVDSLKMYLQREFEVAQTQTAGRPK